jgi:deoxyribodipyrimidine photo-lyase
MDSPLQRLHGGVVAAVPLDPSDLPTLTSLGLTPHGKTLQASGEKAARQILQSFLQVRGYDYRNALSSPLSAQDGCSRLSPHLAFGTLSMRAVHQATEAAIANTPDRTLAYALRGFAGRLRWHCHFMQKLEDEADIELRNFARVCDGLRENDFNGAYFAAWCAGRTGYPMVDACMRSLVSTGWLNFRMRAMLVSFASYHLWLHWRPTGLFLARHFLDFEPGIHWSQMQMQSGTTGINTLRMYSPTKQAQDQDPQGIFIRRWVPKLARVPLPYLAEPWKMDVSVQRVAGCMIGVDYPAPIVDDNEAMKAAKDRMYGLRQSSQARDEASAVQARHGSRKSGLPPSRQRLKAVSPQAAKRAVKERSQPSLQGDLFALSDGLTLLSPMQN